MRSGRNVKRILLIVFLLYSVFRLCACTGEIASADDEASLSFESMDTYMTVTVYGNEAEAAAAAAKEEIERLDSVLSAESEGSEVYEINKNGGGQLSEDTACLLEASLALWEETNGAYDITIYPAAELWGFTTGSYSVPSDEELFSVLELVGSDMLSWDSESTLLSMREGMAIGFGAIAKGYSGDKLFELFEEYDITGAIASLGGNIAVYGEKPDKSAWKIAIQDPEDTSAYICVLSLEGGVSVVTSGGYERYFEEDGVTYYHILDPETACPADSGLLSVSIISENGTAADGLSTALFVMGLDEAIEFWKSCAEYEFEMILVDEDKDLYITEGLEDSCSSSYDITVIYR